MPFLRSVHAPETERTAGISSARAMMAECEVRPPVSVTMPATFFLSMVAVMDGVRSCTTMTVPAGSTERSTTSLPRSSARMPVRMSSMSVTRWRMSSSSLMANMVANMSQTSESACSAHMPPALRLAISSSMNGSLAMLMWPAMISASASPTDSFMCSTWALVFWTKASSARS